MIVDRLFLPLSVLSFAIPFGIGYAITDELHQTLVDGRVGTWRDVLIDSAGALTAALLIRRSTTHSGGLTVAGKDAGRSLGRGP